MKLPGINQRAAFLVLRGITGLIFISHGLARLYYGSVTDFGAFLNAKGLGIGVQLAWLITLGEIISGCLLGLGLWVRYCAIFHAIIILSGVFMVHLPRGWFVVGHSSGGVEYSLLILAVLAFLYSYAHSKDKV